MMVVLCLIVTMVLNILFERGQNEADLDRKGAARLNQSILLMTSNC